MKYLFNLNKTKELQSLENENYITQKIKKQVNKEKQKNIYNNKNIIFKVMIMFFVMINILNTVMASVVDKSYVKITSPSAIVMDSNSGRVLYEKNILEKRSIASLTKVMTSIMLVEYTNMDELIDVPNVATWIGGSEAGLKVGDKVTAKDLLYGMLLPSGNDCAYTVAIHIGGTIENFAKMMNEKALKIGVTNSNFVTPHGLDSENQYSCALDVAKIMRYAMKIKEIKKAMGTENITVKFGSRNKTLNNTNRLLRSYEPVDGGKTGYTSLADRCLALSATSGDLSVITVVLGATDTDKRFNEAKELMVKTFEKYKLRDISNYLNWYIKIAVNKGNINFYEDYKNNNLKVALTDKEYDNIYIKQDIIRVIESPMKIGTNIGKISVSIEEEKLYEEDIILKTNIEKNNVWDYIKNGISDMFVKRDKM